MCKILTLSGFTCIERFAMLCPSSNTTTPLVLVKSSAPLLGPLVTYTIGKKNELKFTNVNKPRSVHLNTIKITALLLKVLFIDW